MKLYLHATLTLLCILHLLGCSKKDRLSVALEMAEDNRIELEKVLVYYKNDSLKYRAACFLIENMIGKKSISYSNGNQIIIPDITNIPSEVLIHHIDLAVEVWQKYPWCRCLNEDAFFRKLLPYRIKTEPIEDWRNFYYHKYKTVADSLASRGATISDVVFFLNSRYGKRYIHDANKYRGDLSYHLIEEIGGGTCDHLALNAAQVMRSIGIPLNVDVLPYHGKVNGGHAYNSFTDENGQFVYFSPYEREPDRKQWVAPIVVRLRYEYPGYEIVTPMYYKTADVYIPEKNVRLATLNRGRFKVLLNGEDMNDKTLFRCISLGLLYFPVNAYGEAANTPPFILRNSGDCQYIPFPDMDKLISIDTVYLYDAKRKLKVIPSETYILKGWHNGWKEIGSCKPKDSLFLSFENIPDYKLFLVYGEGHYLEQMQRPFIINHDTLEYY